MASGEVYTVELARAGFDGSRRLQFHEDSGDEVSLGDNGVITVVNGLKGAIIQINPHAWNTFSTDNISMEDTNG